MSTSANKEVRNPTIYIWVNKGLEMSAGKVASQSAHAVAQVFAQLPQEDLQNFWHDEPIRTIIVFEARDEMHLRNIRSYLGDRGVATDAVIDEGANEVPPHTMTAVCTGILNKHEATDKLMSSFTLYKEEPSAFQIMWPKGTTLPGVTLA